MRILFFLFLASALCALQRRETPIQIKTSVIVPCHADHVHFLDNLFTCFANQTIPPDEIVVSVSEAFKIASFADLEQKTWPFALKILKHKQAYLPGRNRNEACAVAKGDVFICQDADDLPHPQRVEIIKYLFENFRLEHLIHLWIYSYQQFHPCRIEDLESQCVSFRSFDLIDVPFVHNGSCSFVRSVFEKVHWTARDIHEDVLFNRSAYAQSSHKAILKVPLLMYRFELSTFDLDGNKPKK
ncbi:MAG: glycosyltransferase [Verrucomicrobiota bacterium]|nr:glycosyltransferase [Verrucomicrobiota bacterium]